MFDITRYDRQHYYYEPVSFDSSKTEERLLLNYKFYKQLYYIRNFKTGETLLPALYNIDYKQAI